MHIRSSITQQKLLCNSQPASPGWWEFTHVATELLGSSHMHNYVGQVSLHGSEWLHFTLLYSPQHKQAKGVCIAQYLWHHNLRKLHQHTAGRTTPLCERTCTCAHKGSCSTQCAKHVSCSEAAAQPSTSEPVLHTCLARCHMHSSAAGLPTHAPAATQL